MYLIKGKKAEKIESVTFSDLKMQESDIEEILRVSIDMLCSEEESMLIVGQQVKNEKNARSDLTAVDNNGNLVLIEIKRDRKDIENRKEPFEFQAIRYAASYGTIQTPEELVKKVYAPYIDKYSNEFELGELTSYELGIRKLNDFLRINEAVKNFNEKQKIILAASEFDEQTLSAVAWLNSNQVDISCYKLTPFQIDNEVYLKTDKLLPVPNYSDYYVNLLDKPEKTVKSIANRRENTLRNPLPKINAMLDWGVVKEGDIIVAKGRDDEAVLLASGKVLVKGQEVTIQTWLKKLYGWSSVQTYVFAIHKESGRSLSQIREEYMEKMENG